MRSSTIATRAKRTTSQRLKPAKRSTKRTKKTASSILVPKYIESSASEEEKEEKEPSRGEFTLDGRVFRKATDFASGRQRSKTSHVWDKDKGFEIIDIKTNSRHYYCIECCDRRKDKNYVPLIIKGISNITDHWKSKHGIDRNGKPIQTSTLSSSGSLVSSLDFTIWKLVLIQWIVYCHIAFSQIENPYFRKLVRLLNKGMAGLIPCRNTIATEKKDAS
jgi:hypothetical protein